MLYNNNKSALLYNDIKSTESHDSEVNSLYVSMGDAFDKYVLEMDGLMCRCYGGLSCLLNLATVWIVVGLHCDKYCAIASPLLYNQIVTRRRIAIFSSLVWVFSCFLSVLASALARDFEYVGGTCLPVWYNETGEIVYTIVLAAILIVLPLTLFSLANGKILLIARRHHYRIMSAIFEVMMSAQATVTKEGNPFGVPKIKHKSAKTVCEQLVAFLMCYCPLFLYVVLECILMYPISESVATSLVGCLMLAPLFNSILYGFRSATVKKIMQNYNRKQISRSVMKCEIEARIPSTQNSRRPSLSSTLGLPFIHKKLVRRRSDFLNPDLDLKLDQNDIIRRSSDLSRHPFEQGTPTSSRLRQPLDLPNFECSEGASNSHFLTVPNLETCKNLTNNASNTRGSVSSLDSDDMFGEKEQTPVVKPCPVMTESQSYGNTFSFNINPKDHVPNYLVSSTDDDCAFVPNGRIENSLSVNLPIYRRSSSAFSSMTSEDTQPITSSTPLLCRAYLTPWPKVETSNTESPYILRTLESLMSVGISQSKLLRSKRSLWRTNSSDKTIPRCKIESLIEDSQVDNTKLAITNNSNCINEYFNMISDIKESDYCSSEADVIKL